MNRRLRPNVVGPLLVAFVVQFPWTAALRAEEKYPPNAGKVHPQVVLRTLEGDRAIALSSLRGKKVLLIHFASWSEKSREELPVWCEKTKPLIAGDKLAVLAIAHEQYAERPRLFNQWKNINWPTLHDPLNIVNVESLPLIVAIDEHGVVREFEPDPDKIEEAFLSKTFTPPKKDIDISWTGLPEPRVTRRQANDGRSAKYWCEHGNALVLAGLSPQINEAIDAYRQAISMDKTSADAFFGMGVAFRIRYDRLERQPTDFQSAIDAWREAARLAADNEVFLARLQEYGPTLGRSQSFYQWIEAARKTISQRGDTPIALPVEPSVLEKAAPAKKFIIEPEADAPGEPSDKGEADAGDLVRVDQTVVRGLGKHENIVAVLVTFRPDFEREVHWNESTAPLRLWLKKGPNAKLSKGCVSCSASPDPAGDGPRTLCFEARLTGQGAVTIDGLAVYAVRQGKDGQPKKLHRDIHVKIGPEAK